MGEKEQTFRKSKILLELQATFLNFLNVRSFSPGGLFTFLVAVAHGEAVRISIKPSLRARACVARAAVQKDPLACYYRPV